jgi:hypothetical protein
MMGLAILLFEHPSESEEERELYFKKSMTSETSQAHKLCFASLQNIAMLSGK